MHRVGTEQRVLMPDEVRDINNRTIGINPDFLAPQTTQAGCNESETER